MGNFVSKFALPALLFKNMVLLDFGDVIWSFLWSVLIAKVCPFVVVESLLRRHCATETPIPDFVQVAVFALVCVLTLMVASPEDRYSKAGLYAIFATQSNDFALGYPIGETLSMS